MAAERACGVVLAATVYETTPCPEPFADANVIQLTLLVAVQLQLSGAVTSIAPIAPAAAAVIEACDTVTAQGTPVSLMVNAWVPIMMEPVREAEVGFASVP